MVKRLRLRFGVVALGLWISIGVAWGDGPDPRLAVAQRAADAAMARLKANLQEKMAEGGPANAIPFCHASALPITAEEVSGKVLSVERLTLKPRNPKNRAKGAEAKLLKEWEAKLVRKEELPRDFHRIEKGRLEYFRPIRLEGQCLVCHGAVEQMDSRVSEVISKKYPADQAKGYSAGDLRGMIRVVVR